MMSVGFRPTEADSELIEAHRRPGEATADVLRRALRALDQQRWAAQAREDMERIAASGEDLSEEPDEWGFDGAGQFTDLRDAQPQSALEHSAGSTDESTPSDQQRSRTPLPYGHVADSTPPFSVDVLTTLAATGFDLRPEDTLLKFPTTSLIKTMTVDYSALLPNLGSLSAKSGVLQGLPPSLRRHSFYHSPGSTEEVRRLQKELRQALDALSVLPTARNEAALRGFGRAVRSWKRASLRAAARRANKR